MTDFFGIHWAGLDRAILFPFFAIIIGLIIYRLKQQQQFLKLIIHKKNIQVLFKGFSLRRQRVKAFLLISGLIILFFALLQPQWGKKEETVVQEGRDLLIMLDISRSMLAQDLKPNRLEFAKIKIRALLDRLPVDRIGLIIFSGSAIVQCPLTADHHTVLSFLNQIVPETISSGTTSIDAALTQALRIFGKSEGRKNKLGLLITDGEDFSTNLNTIQRKAIQEQLHLFALGIGSKEGAPIPILDARGNQVGHERDATGNVALSSLDEKKLTTLCSALSGHAVVATYNNQDIEQLGSLIEQYEKETFTDKSISRYDEQYPWLIICSFVLLALEWIL